VLIKKIISIIPRLVFLVPKYASASDMPIENGVKFITKDKSTKDAVSSEL
jgi:hypothetical protein